MDDLTFTDAEFDALKEVANIGAGHALGTLSNIISQTIELEVPDIKYLKVNEIDPHSHKDFVAVFSPMQNPHLKGNIILAFPLESFQEVLRMINSDMSNIDQSEDEIKQIGANVFESYSKALEHFLQFNLNFKETSFILSTKKEYLLPILRYTRFLEERALLIKTKFRCNESGINGHFEMAFTKSAVEYLKGKVKAEYGL